MKKKKTVQKRLLPVLVLICCVGFMAGCQENRRQVTFKEQMNLGIEAAQVGDLEMAKLHVESVRPCAKTFNQKRMVESMDGLISGAEAMMDGDPLQARTDWANIPDPQLNRQVRINADVVMGVKVPVIAVTKEVKK